MITEEELYIALYNKQYKCNTPTVILSDVEIARKAINFEQSRASMMNEKIEPSIMAINQEFDNIYQRILSGEDVSMISSSEISTIFTNSMG